MVAALEHVANRPILHHALEGLAAAGVDAVIVAGEADTLIDVRASLEDHQSGWPIDKLDYAVCRGGTGLASALRAVAPLVAGSACLLQPADGLHDGPVLPLLEALEEGSSELILFETSPPSEDRLGGAWYEEAGAAHRSRSTNVALFAPGTLLEACEAMARYGASDLATAGRRLAAGGTRVMVRPLDTWRRYGGDRRALLDLNRVALDRLAVHSSAPNRPTNRIEGRVLIDDTAVITNSVVIGPTVIGAGAVVDEAYVGPYTSIGAHARIEGAEIERSIVLERASIVHVGGRLASSLVGREARVFRDFSLPRALRLVAGSGDEIALC